MQNRACDGWGDDGATAEPYSLVYPLSASRMRGLGKELQDGQDATDYVQRLRAEWARG